VSQPNQPNQPGHPISGDDVMLRVVPKPAKSTGPGYTPDEIDELLASPVPAVGRSDAEEEVGNGA